MLQIDVAYSPACVDMMCVRLMKTAAEGRVTVQYGIPASYYRTEGRYSNHDFQTHL